MFYKPLYTSKALAEAESLILNSTDFYQYTHGHGTLSLACRLQAAIDVITYGKLGSYVDRAKCKTYLETRLSCYDAHNLISGYTLHGFFYECATGHGKSREIYDAKLPLEKRNRKTMKLYDLYFSNAAPQDRFMSGELAIANKLAIANPARPV
jgi:hypothetical protein